MEPEVQPVTSLHPGAVHITRPVIPEKFDNGVPLVELLKQILYGKLRVQDLPKIEVAHVGRQWYVIKGNRRLFLYKLLSEQASHLLVRHHVPVVETRYVPEHREVDTRFLTSTEEYALFHSELGQELSTTIQQWKTGPFYRAPPAPPAPQCKPADVTAMHSPTPTPVQKPSPPAKKAPRTDNGDTYWLDCVEHVIWSCGRCFKCGFYFAIFSFLFLHMMSQFYLWKRDGKNATGTIGTKEL